jgi:futalosine hydrolase
VLVVPFATSLEGALLEGVLGGARGTAAGRAVVLLRTGVGPVNAAAALAALLARERATAVVCCGVGGAYPGSGLATGDVACAESETYADLGAESPSGFLDMEALGFPVIEGAPPIFNRLPLDLFPAARRVPFVTRTTCTGTDAAAREIAARTKGAVESMEGAAIAHVARLHGVPVGEVRGISNRVGDRDRRSWRVREAAEAAQRALLEWLASC